MRNFMSLLRARWNQGKFVCVGLDPDYNKLPECVRARAKEEALPGRNGEYGAIVSFCLAIVDATKGYACAFKPNSAFFEGMPGLEGMLALREVIMRAQKIAPEVPVILDAKRADIDNTNKGYAVSAFERLNADAITVHPYLGQEALQPLLDYKDKGIIVLCQTSNKGADEFQGLSVGIDLEIVEELERLRVVPFSAGIGGCYTRLSYYVAWQVARKWNKNENCALVVGATYPSELQSIRRIAHNLPILIPGIGAQGGNLEDSVKAGKDQNGQGMIINASRSIIYASSEPDFAEAAGREAQKMNEAINKCR